MQGLYSHSRDISKYFEELFSAYLPNSWGKSLRCEYMPRLFISTRASTEKQIGKLLKKLLRARGTLFILAKKNEDRIALSSNVLFSRRMTCKNSCQQGGEKSFRVAN